jgi:hypothetical protein
MRVYHGGTEFTQKFKRPYAALNGGSIGYYVTTDYQQAQCYGFVHTYEFSPKLDMSTTHLTKAQAKKLNQLTRYWESYGESPTNPTAIAALMSGNVYESMMESINATGEMSKTIQYIQSLGYTHASQPDPNVFIVIANLKLIN